MVIYYKISKFILIILIILLASFKLFASDTKSGRFFEDQPDVNNDYQVHFIYLLEKKQKIESGI